MGIYYSQTQFGESIPLWNARSDNSIGTNVDTYIFGSRPTPPKGVPGLNPCLVEATFPQPLNLR